ncbi:hypothetical protein BDF22DRAFT_778709 [Syncephalis plumigaleata]|nr:hypothetical protein BDF22DRAFT_778709 [Syncephalis plumigaleata]
MRVTSHSALAISACALALLSQISSVHSYNGVSTKDGKYPITSSGQRYIVKHQQKLGLSDLVWIGGDYKELSLARVTWNNQVTFMKCDQAGYKLDLANLNIPEVSAFKALLEAQRLTGVYTTGRQNVMNPLHHLYFDDVYGMTQLCHLYSYINGVLLDDYFKGKTFSQAFIIASEILPQVIKGSIYLYNAGIFHEDVFPKNIMIQEDPIHKLISAKIIDLDSTAIIKGKQDWQPINPSDEECLSSNPTQKYASCDKLKKMIQDFLQVFVSLEEGENPFNSNYRITVKEMQDYLGVFKQREFLSKKFGHNQFLLTSITEARNSIGSELGAVNTAISAMLRLKRALYTLNNDRFTCSSPMRALKGLPPRTSWFKW